MKPAFRWLAYHLSVLSLAFLLAVVVWVSAVLTADPNEQYVYRPTDIQIIGQNENLLILGEIPKQARLTLQAPRSIWEKLNGNPSLVKVWIDLTGLGPGEHTVPVKAEVNIRPIRYFTIDPEQIRLTLEPLQKRSAPVDLVMSGNLPLGYRSSVAQLTPTAVTVSGPESAVEQVKQVRARLDLSGATETIHKRVTLEALDDAGQAVAGVLLSPHEVEAQVSVSLLGGYKNAAVKVVTKGQVAGGYRLSNILVSPPTVTLFSNNPQLIEQIPGYVETQLVDLTNLVDDIEISVDLNLPTGVTAVRDPKVVVQVSVAALEGSLTLSVPVETIGLPPNLQALISPTSVDVIVSGPLSILEKLTPSNFRVVLDLTGLSQGVYQRQVMVDQAPKDVEVQTSLPEIVEVTIRMASGVPTSAPYIAP